MFLLLACARQLHATSRHQRKGLTERDKNLCLFLWWESLSLPLSKPDYPSFPPPFLFDCLFVMAFCGDYGYGAGAMACAPAVGCAPTVACAPTLTAAPAVGQTSVEAWGKPVYKKKWLFGKWKYSGMSDVKYVPRTHAAPAPILAAPAPILAAPAPMMHMAAPVCAPVATEGCYGAAPIAAESGVQ